MTYQTILVSLLPIIAMINLIMNKSHFLHVLLCLEIITLSMLLYLSFYFMMFNLSTPLLSVIILTLGACEASLGLTLLVMMVRMFGNDMLKNISVSKC